MLPPTGYQLELLTESGGFDGEIVWKADRSRGLMSAGAEVIRAGDGTGEFAGRSLMVLVKGGPGDQPQIAEIEVYPALRPEARQWQADGRELEGGGMVAVPAGTEDLSFTAACAVPAEGLAGFRWKLGNPRIIADIRSNCPCNTGGRLRQTADGPVGEQCQANSALHCEQAPGQGAAGRVFPSA